jgi:hypothetical protein
MKVRRITTLILCLVVVDFLAACCYDDGGSSLQPAVDEVEVATATGIFKSLGATLQLTAVARDADGNAISDVSFTWSSSNNSVARVSSSGEVTAVDNGMVKNTATADGIPGTADITVQQTVSSVVITPITVDTLIGVGDVVQFTAVAFDANAYPVQGSSFTWTSSDMGVGRVDNTGLVTTFGNGITTITAEEARGVTGDATFKSATVLATESLTMDFDVSVGGTTPVGLTYDGSDYYTTYGGSPVSQILRFRINGSYVSATTVPTDARALLVQ